jgi:(p)ppGpp synthase/HD superfamily hydrolase
MQYGVVEDPDVGMHALTQCARSGVFGVQAREPEVFARLKADVDVKLRQSQATITEFTHDAVKVLEKAGVCIEDAEGRPKSLTSIREKLRRKGLSLQVRTVLSLHQNGFKGEHD